MRLIRLGAFLAWAAIASLAVAGFAAFSAGGEAAPVAQPAPRAVVPALESAAVGEQAGRVAAMTFARSGAATAGEPIPVAVSERLTEIAEANVAVELEVADLTDSTAAPTTTTEESTVPTTVATTTPTTAPPPSTTTTTTVVATTTTAPPATTTTVPPTTTTTEAPGLEVPGGTEAWVGLVETFFAAADQQRALDVIWCESRGDSGATNPSSGAAGLFQHLPQFWEERSANAGWSGADIYEPTANVAVAAWLVYYGGGWSHWNPSAFCWG